jgi:hypothetical protein
MRFSDLLNRLSEVQACGGLDATALAHHLGQDPELQSAAALDQAQAGQLSFLESGNALAAALAASHAGALLLPAKGEEAAALQSQASAAGMAWIALNDPRLGFAEALDALYPRQPKPPGIHASAVVDPSAVVGMGSHVGAFSVIGAAVQIGAGCTIHPHVVIYDDEHYFMGGALAEKLAREGHKVTLVTPNASVSSWTAMTDEIAFLHTRLHDLGVSFAPNRLLLGHEKDSLQLACTASGQESGLPCGTLVLVTGRLPEDRLHRELSAAAHAFGLHRVGDCLQPSSVADAVYSAHRFARELGTEPPAAPRRERPPASGSAIDLARGLA